MKMKRAVQRCKKNLSLLITAALVFALLPATASAAGSDLSVTTTKALGTDYTYAAGVLTFINPGDYTVSMTTPGATTTTDRIVVSGGTEADPVNITLNGADINVSGADECAFQLTGNAVVRLTLTGTNRLKSSGGNAGLQVPAGTALTIDGTGSLYAEKIYKDGSNLYGAGIGGGHRMATGNITIIGGTVTANSSDLGAGIGGGTVSTGGAVTISGGTVSAQSSCGAGIGGGQSSRDGTVTITGGTVSAQSVAGAGIGGGQSSRGGTVTITGGTVSTQSTIGAGIGNGAGGGGGSTVTITGGSVKMNGFPVTPKNGTGTDVFLTTVTLDGINAETPVSSLSTSAGYAYGTDGMKTDAAGKLYLYLPSEVKTTAAKAAQGKYSGEVTTKTDSASSLGTLALETIPPTVSAVVPVGGGDPISDSIAVTFNEEMRPGTGTVSLDGGTTNLTGGTWSVSNTVYTVPYAFTVYAPSYPVKISGFQDYSGNVMSEDTNHSFNTLPAPDLEVSITDGAATANPGGTVTYTITARNNGPSTAKGATVACTLPAPLSASWTAAGTGGTFAASGSGPINDTVSLPSGASVTYTVVASISSGASGTLSTTATVSAPAGVTDPNHSNNSATDTTSLISSGSGSSGGSGGGGKSSPGYSAGVPGGGSLPVAVNAGTKTASVNVDARMGGLMAGGENKTIKMPSIPGVSTYSLGVPVAYLTTSGGGSLTFDTDTGSITLPADMLAGVPGASGKAAQISMGKGDKAALPAAAQSAIGNRPLIQLSLTLDGAKTEWNNPNAPVRIAIPYSPTAEELKNPDSIIIWYIDGSGKPFCIANGRYDGASGTVAFETTHFSLYAVGYSPVRFSDVAGGAWHYDAVSFAAARGIAAGTGNGSFSPDKKLTRGDFLVMLLRAYGITEDTHPADNFTDAGSTYYTGYLAAAKQLGIAKGVGHSLFAPEKPITRQEMFTLLHNALKSFGRLPEGTASKKLSDFSDHGAIADWARNPMTLLVETGTVTGSGDKLLPGDTTTRAEMAQVLYRLLKE